MSGLGVFESIEDDPSQEEVEALDDWMESAMTEYQDDMIVYVSRGPSLPSSWTRGNQLFVLTTHSLLGD